MTLHINCPTRKNTCIDHIASNITNVHVSVHNLELSDHNTGQTLEFPLKVKTVNQFSFKQIRKKTLIINQNL